ncbi:MAG: hypothetical protein AVDCRST_MAG50-2066 [uncultured Acidimicrobiales bacterium]|uniref:DNA-directed DNA polymerase n=1 Tax=uncultured Acidimicrobiales bacterium TaxID=310071 RepID=A0A6J4IBQ7_9ACTN|nr:MAG: hypothetical protein AVDCRST_MAG50-2066 [uncultured Acidimicrobiales bacterium]
MTDVFAGLVGQPSAAGQLRAAARAPVHAYLVVGAGGTGTREAARGFAACLLCRDGGCGECSDCRRAIAERHPDLAVFERVGASISRAQIDEILRLAVRPPSEGARKVLVLVDFHLVAQEHPRLLKTLEEPPASTVFVVLAEQVPPELVTIASRCVRVDLGPVAVQAIADALVVDGVEPDVAIALAEASGGRIDRARLLAADSGFAARSAAWRSVAGRLDGAGATVASLTDELLGTIDTVLGPLEERQAAEVRAVEERIAQYGERGSGRKELDERHKREQRRVRQDELRFGLLTLAGAYRDQLVDDERASTRSSAMAAIRALDAAGEALVRNPNETLLLQGLLVRLTEAAEAAPPVGSAAGR